MSTPLLAADDVWKRYGGRAALAGVSVEVAPGEALGIIGPNGSGKSTLLNVISRLAEPDAGRVLLEGEDLLVRPAWKLAAAGVTRVFQSARLCPHLTVQENVALGLYWVAGPRARLKAGDPPREERERVLHWLDMVGLAERRSDTPEALTHYQARCAELARALASRPRLLLLDEPAAGFSAGERAAFLRLLRSVRDPATAILFVEHDFELVRQACDRVMVLDAGRCIASGPPPAVHADPAVLKVYFGGAHAPGV